MVSVNILIQALEQYQGTFIVISRRFFVENVYKIWYIEDFPAKIPGTYVECSAVAGRPRSRQGWPAQSIGPYLAKEKSQSQLPANLLMDQKKALRRPG
jgi:ATP-binding cassette subfamily F protein 3